MFTSFLLGKIFFKYTAALFNVLKYYNSPLIIKLNLYFRNILAGKKETFKKSIQKTESKFNFLRRNLKNMDAFQTHRFNIRERNCILTDNKT